MEWRCSKAGLFQTQPQAPPLNGYKVIIDETNVLQPSALHSMNSNCEGLMDHLRNISSLDRNDIIQEHAHEDREGNKLINNSEILTYATQHDLPIFIRIEEG